MAALLHLTGLWKSQVAYSLPFLFFFFPLPATWIRTVYYLLHRQLIPSCLHKADVTTIAGDLLCSSHKLLHCNDFFFFLCWNISSHPFDFRSLPLILHSNIFLSLSSLPLHDHVEGWACRSAGDVWTVLCKTESSKAFLMLCSCTWHLNWRM